VSKRSKACDITPKVRAEVYKRDGYRCIICGSSYMLTVAHLVGRAQGGLAIKENLVTLEMSLHNEADNGKNTKEVKKKMREYLENLYPGFTDEQRKYNKWREK